MQHRSLHIAVALAVVFSALPLLAFPQGAPAPQEPPPAEKQAPKDQAPAPRLDLYGDPLPEGAVARMGTVRFRHPAELTAIAFSPDGRKLASCGLDSAINIWDIHSGEALQRLVGHELSVRSISFSPDGKNLVSSGGDNTICLWDPTTGNRRLQIRSDLLLVRSVAFSPNGRILASTGFDRTRGQSLVVLWDATTGRQIRRLRGHDNLVSSVAFSPDGAKVASDSLDKTIRVWDVSTADELLKLPNHPVEADGDLADVTFSQDGKLVAAVRNGPRPGDSAVLLWDGETGEEFKSISGHEGRITSFSFCPGGETLASVGMDDSVRVWSIASGAQHLRFDVCGVSLIAFSPDGKTLASGSKHSIQLWDVATGKNLSHLAAHQSAVSSVCFSPDGRTLASGSTDGAIRIWEATSGKQYLCLRGHQGVLRSLAFSPNGKELISRSDDSLIRVWNTRTGRLALEFRSAPPAFWEAALQMDRVDEIGELEGPGGGKAHIVSSFTYSPDGRLLATGSLGGTVRIRDMHTQSELAEIEAAEVPILAVGISGEEQTLALWAADRSVQLWDIVTAAKLRENRIDARGVTCVSLFPEVEKVAIGNLSGKICIRELFEDGEAQVLEAGDSQVVSLHPSGDGRLLMSGNDETICRIWDLTLGRELLTLSATPSRRTVTVRKDALGKKSFDYGYGERMATSVAMSPDGGYLASGHPDNMVRLWELGTASPVCEFQGHGGTVRAVYFSPDGRFLASASDDTTVLVWDLRLVGKAEVDETGETAPAEDERIWVNLAGGDSLRAYEAMRRLASMRRAGIAFLRDRMRPISHVVEEQIPSLINDLGHEQFKVRDEASKVLRRMGEAPAPALRRILEGSPTPEVRLRVDRLLRRLEPPVNAFPSEVLRSLRAIHILEWIDTEDAREFLKWLGGGSPYALQTREAKAALERLEGRQKSE